MRHCSLGPSAPRSTCTRMLFPDLAQGRCNDRGDPLHRSPIDASDDGCELAWERLGREALPLDGRLDPGGGWDRGDQPVKSGTATTGRAGGAAVKSGTGTGLGGGAAAVTVMAASADSSPMLVLVVATVAVTFWSPGVVPMTVR